MDKKYFRDIVRLKLEKLLPDEKEKLDNKIFKNLTAHQIFKNCKDIFTYISLKNEVDTLKIIRYALEMKKKIFAPITFVNEKIIKVGYINSLSNLRKGAFNILQPPSENIIEKKDFDILIIPGLCFDKNGIRIGKGAGYFDRFLINVKGIKIGLCYSFQVFDNLPYEPHDIKVDMLFTDEFIFDFRI